jgi:glutamine amidotransferase PdxT
MVSSFHPELTDDLRLHQLFLDSFDHEEVTSA